MPEPDNPGLPLPPPLLFVIPLVLFLGLEWLAPTHFVAPPWRALLAAASLAGGIALVAAGALAQRRAGTDFLPERPSTRIVTTGVYARTRNPMYIGFALLTLGFAAAFDSSWGLLAVPVGIVLVDRIVIAREERYLERKFGEEYLAYKRRVRRWL